MLGPKFLKKFRWFFGRNDGTKRTFWNKLTFSSILYFVYKPHFGTWIHLFGASGHLKVVMNTNWVFLINICGCFFQLFAGKIVSILFLNSVDSALESCLISLFLENNFSQFLFWLKIFYHSDFNSDCKRERGFID